jgi:alkanesulfonate monooxygenase SsuD/methylene tetrahydromethanopterin reductase-like flavin-dependent oxidoreductase (luciferase family)
VLCAAMTGCHTYNEPSHLARRFATLDLISKGRAMSQGRPVIVQADASEQGRDLGAASADVIYAINATLDGARGHCANVKGRMAKYGREPDDLKIMSAFCPVVARTRAEAQELVGGNLLLRLVADRHDVGSGLPNFFIRQHIAPRRHADAVLLSAIGN